MLSSLYDWLIQYPAIRRMGMLFAAVVVWSNLLTACLTSGALWSLTKDRLTAREDFMATAQLFEIASDKRPDVLIIGDGIFLSHILPSLPPNTRAATIRIPRIDLNHASNIVSNLGRISPRVLVLQNSPYFWSNLGSRGPRARLEPWQFYGQSPLTLFPNGETRFFFDLITEWVRTSPVVEAPADQRPVNPIQLAFAPNPPGWLALKKAILDKNYKVLWVSDRNGVAYTLVPDLLKNFNQMASSRMEHGLWIEASVLRKTLNVDFSKTFPVQKP